jgi:hypothetical protein
MVDKGACGAEKNICENRDLGLNAYLLFAVTIEQTQFENA